jgi:hypothetical protein
VTTLDAGAEVTGAPVPAADTDPGTALDPVRPPTTRSRRSRYRKVLLEVLFLGTLYLAYSLTRLRFTAGYSDALHNAHRVLGAEHSLVRDFDLPLNHVVITHALVGIPAAWYYATAHYLCTAAMLVWLWRRHPHAYARARAALVAITVIGLAVFVVFPVAPPRLLHGTAFVDGMARWSHFGFWGSGASAPRGAEDLTNQYAAMPSLHVGWALWCAWWTFKLSEKSRSRWTAWLHPLITAVVVVATANHYSVDVIAGVAVVLIGEILIYLAVRLWRAWRPQPFGRSGAAPPLAC